MKRWTRQRRAILNAMQKALGPQSIEEIMTSVLAEIPKINLSTIYRNIKSLIEESEIKVIQLPGKLARYERVHQRHLHHFLCEVCEKLYNISFCPKDILAMVPPGFKMISHSITLRGTCRSCLESKENL